jgi:site-specific DNA-methyltransferase (adenine-specific)
MIELDKIYNMDCITGMQMLPDNSVDLIVTSPPYNIGIDYDVYEDDKSWDEYYSWCEKWLRECYRVLKKDGGRICLDHYLSLGTSKYRTSPISTLYTIMEKIGFKHHSIAVWTDITLAKRTAWGSYLKASAPYINSPFEGILIDYKENWKKLENGTSTIEKDDFVKLTRGVWDIKTETRGLTKANFSLDLPTKAINLLSYDGDVILDPFIGSGTTAVAAKKLNRHYIGFEISENYCKIAENRLNNLDKK